MQEFKAGSTRLEELLRKLAGNLHCLKDQVLYYDTDSVIYSWKEDQPQIEIGDFLGDL